MRTTQLVVSSLIALGLGATAARAEEVPLDEAARRLARAARDLEREVLRARRGQAVDPARVRHATRDLEGAHVRAPEGSVPLDDSVGEALKRLDDAAGRDDAERAQRELEALSGLASARAREAARIPGVAGGRLSDAPPAAAPAPGETRRPEPPRRRPPSTSPDEARRSLGEILARPRFRPREEIPDDGTLVDRLAALAQRIRDWIASLFAAPTAPGLPGWLSRFFGWVAGLLSATGWTVLAWSAVAATACFAAVFFYRRARNAFKGAAAAGEEAAAVSIEDVEAAGAVPKREEPWTESRWRREAGELATRGDTRGALRACFQLLLIALHRAGRIRLEKGRTNWEHVDDVRRRDPPLASSMEPHALAFDLVWYGRRALSREDLERHREGLEALEKRLDAGPAGDAP